MSFFIIGDWNAKVGSQEAPGVMGKFGFVYIHMDITRWPYEIRLVIFFVAGDGETLYSQQNQDWELTVAQIMNSFLSNSDLNRRK